MKLVQYSDSSLTLRYSIHQFVTNGMSSKQVLSSFLHGETHLDWEKAEGVVRAVKCAEFLESIKERVTLGRQKEKVSIIIDSADYIVTLATLYTPNIIKTSYLSSSITETIEGFSKYLSNLSKQDKTMFQVALDVHKYMKGVGFVKNDNPAVYFLVANLFLVQSNNMLVLEDTDDIDQTLTLQIRRILEKNS